MPTASRRRWKLRTAIASVALPPVMYVVTLDRLMKWLPDPRQTIDPAAPPDEELASWVDSALYQLPWPWRRTCLKRAVVLYYLLGRAGRPATMNIGVRKQADGELEAHAWLTRDEAVVLEPPTSNVVTFQRIAALP